MKYYMSKGNPNCIWIVDYDKMQYDAYFINQGTRSFVMENFTISDLFENDTPMTEEEAFLEML